MAGLDGGCSMTDADGRARLADLLRTKELVHPLSSSANFTDLAHGLALCCGIAPEAPVRHDIAAALAEEVSGSPYARNTLC